jgi:hypothetical protein
MLSDMRSSDRLQKSLCESLTHVLGRLPTWALNLRYGLRYGFIHVSGRHCALRVVMRQSRTSDGIHVGIVEFDSGVVFHLVAPFIACIGIVT